MEQLEVDGALLEYAVEGSGEPVLLIHLSMLADGLSRPLLEEGSLPSLYRVISYHRRGYIGSTVGTPPVSVQRQAADAVALLDHLGVERAHVCGHSYGAVIALQLAADRPDLVHSLAMLEPALQMVPSGRAHVERNVFPAVEHYRSGDKRAALETFLSGVFGGQGWEKAVETAVPGALDQAVADADMFFGVEIPAIRQWTFGPEQAAKVTQPVLSVVGTESVPLFVDGRQQLHSWFNQTEDFDLQGATHMLQLENAPGMARGLIDFFRHHPIPAPD